MSISIHFLKIMSITVAPVLDVSLELVIHWHIDGDPSIQIINFLRDIDYSLDLVIDGDIHGDVMGTYKQWKNMLSWEYYEVFMGTFTGILMGILMGFHRDLMGI